MLQPNAIATISGIRLATACAGIKQTVRPDVTLVELSPGSTCAGVFTRNAFCAAPVVVAKDHLTRQAPRYWLINSGNANAGTGEEGMRNAQACCQAVANHALVQQEQVLPFSTGVIGQPLPVAKINAVIPSLFNDLQADNWLNAAQAIMTTDTQPKGASRTLVLHGIPTTISGIAKGAGMIRPDMATLLVFIATDAALSQAVLQQALHSALEQSFNRITIDGDTSTNDACVLAATGANGMSAISFTEDGAYAPFVSALTELCVELAQDIVRDGEGATKFVTIQVDQARTSQEALDVAYTIAHSPLVKTALFASDANWGRILAAVGRAGVADLALPQVEIYLDDVCIVRNGGCAPDYTEARGSAVMRQAEITIRIVLARGKVSETVWTCDFSYDYVKINAEYRT